ncbi:MAG TPA: glycosyltransferase family 39 protein [Tepidisphaeraceae bacterium]|jgi:hypothetical protein
MSEIETFHKTPHACAWADRHSFLAILISALVLIPRAIFIANAHSESFDAPYHLRHGLAFATGNPGHVVMNSNDAPLGQMLISLPMIVTGCLPGEPIHLQNWPNGVRVPGETMEGEPPLAPERARYERLVRMDVLYGNRLSPEAILLLIAVWKSILFIPAAGVLFHWCRSLYGLGAAWLSLSLLLIDPNFAAHVPVLALDSLGAEGVLIACYLMWRYFRSPSTRWLIALTIAVAVAMLMKHTAVILPLIFIIMSIFHRRSVSRRDIAIIVLTWFLTVWTLLLFNYSRPIDQLAHLAQNLPFRGTRLGDFIFNVLSQRWPAGAYVGCFVSGFITNQLGQSSMIFGKIQSNGFWYYFPALLTYKMPIGTFIALGIALASFARKKIFRDEAAFVIPLLTFVVFLMFARMNYGIRHFLPAYLFLIMLAGRGVWAGSRWMIATAWTGTTLAAIHSIAFLPDYISYINFPRRRIDLEITDSNLDWNQALRQIRRWLREHNTERLPVYVLPRLGRGGTNGAYWVGEAVTFLHRGKPLPQRGLLIISPVWTSSVYDSGDNAYEILHHVHPIGWVGHAMPVFDLQQVTKARQNEQSIGESAAR